MADATRRFNSIGDVRKVGALIKPNVSAVEDAVDAVSGIAKAPKKGGMSFGFKIGSPDPMPGQQGMPVVAVDGDPLQDIGVVIRNVRWVMKGGKLVVDRTCIAK
jgi:hypothetical protein